MRGIAAALVLALAVVAVPAAAQNPLPPGQEVKVSADSLVIDESTKEATFSGSVVITRTGLTVRAARVVVVYGAGIDDIQNFDASGSVQIETAGQVATGDRAVFDPKTQILRLTGNVLVQNSAGTMGGAVLTVNLATNDTTFEARPGERVTGVFTPQ